MPHLRLQIASLVAVASLAFGASTAAAAAPDEFPVGGPAWQQAQAVAYAYWNTVPCGGEVTYEWKALEPLTNARATWHNPVDAWNAPQDNFDCTVAFNASMGFDYPMLCTVLTHEVGHLVGREHDDAAGQLMSAIYTEPIPQCADPSAPATETQESTVAPAQITAPEPAAKKKVASKTVKKRTTAKRAKRGKRCFIRMKAGRRVRMCVGHKKRAGRKALSRR